MNKKNKQLVPLFFITAGILFIAIIYTMVGTTHSEYRNISDSKNVVSSQYQTAKDKYEQSKEQRKQDEIQLQSIKPVYETKENSESENLGVFGSMFEDIIKLAQTNGLMIRSIEYDMRPSDDLLFIDYSDIYNVCELKFFIVGTYSQLKVFLKELSTTFNYLTSVSKLNITAFNGNTDYILVNMSINIYSKRPTAK